MMNARLHRVRHAMPRASILITLFALSACSGDCGGCDGFETRDFPVEHYDKTVPHSAQIRLTPTGVSFIEQNIEPLLAGALPDGLSFCIAKEETNNSGQCFPYLSNVAAPRGTQPVCDNGEDGCQLNFTVERTQITRLPPNKLAVEVTLGGINPTVPFKADTPVGELNCDVTIYKNGQSNTTPGTIAALLPLSFSVDQASALKDVRIEPGELELNLDDVAFRLSGDWRCTIASGVANFLPDLIKNLIGNELKKQVGPLLDESLCRSCEGGVACPDNATCNSDALCEYNVGGECVPALLGIEGRLGLGELLADYTEEQEAASDLTLRLADRAVVDTGVSLSMRAGFQPTATSPCAPVDPTTRPSFAPLPVSATINSNTKPVSNQPFMIGFGMHKNAIEQLLWGVWASGATCLGIDSAASDLLSTSTLTFILRSLGDLADNEKRAVEIKIVPQQPPRVVLGANTITEDQAGALTVREGLLTIDWKDLDLNIYGYVQDRYTLLFTVRADLLLPVAIVPDGMGQLKIVPGALDNALQNPRVLNSGILRETPERIASVLPTLIGFALPSLAGSLEQTFELPEFFGLRIALGQGDITSVDNNTFIALFANLEAATQPQVLAPRIALLGAQVSYPAPATPEAVVRPEVKLDVAPLSLVSEALGEVEYSVRVNGGFWGLYQPASALTLRDPMFALPGEHLIEVRARYRGKPHTAQREASSMRVMIDPYGPTLQVEQVEDRLRFVGQDGVDADTTLRYRYRVHSQGAVGQWSDWSATREVSLASIGVKARARVEVQVQDRAGHVTREDVTVTPLVMATPVASSSAANTTSALGCSAAASPNGSSGAPWWLALVGMGWLAAGRRRRLAMASVLGVALGMAGCSDDTPSGQQGCSPACGDGLVCQDRQCVMPPAQCATDEQCEAGRLCINNQCVAPQCTSAAECEITCPSDKRAVCASGRCACETLCAEGCDDGEFCCEQSNSCRELPNPCMGQVCEEGFGPRVMSAGQANTATCMLEGGQCACAKLEPLALGHVGRYASLASGAGKTALSAYNVTYGDLMVASLDSNLRPTWRFVDGVPTTGPVQGALDGPRGGRRAVGEDVGRHTAAVMDDAGTLHVFYQDATQKALKVARGTSQGEGWTFELATLDTSGDPGRWTRAMLKDGTLHVIYQAQAAGGGATTEVRHLQLDPSAPLAELAQVEAQVIFEGPADPPSPQPKGVPQTTGLFMTLSSTDDGLLLVFYDALQRSVGWARYAADAWTMPRYAGTPSGPYAAAEIDAAGVMHLAYMNEETRELLYERVDQGPVEVIQGGVRDTGAQWFRNRIGEGVRLRVLADGQVQVVFQDASLHTLHRGTRAAAGGWQVSQLSPEGMGYTGAHGFYIDLLERAQDAIMVSYTINSQATPEQGEAVVIGLP